MELSFKINEFEGPMDLLLHLISKHKLDIFDIEIVLLVDQYMDYINGLDKTNLEIAGEFIEMATRLIYMKTVMLLPKHDEEKEELKAQLSGQLIEYQACKMAADELRIKSRIGDIFVGNPEEIDAEKEYQHSHNISVLFAAYLNAVGKGKRFLPPPETSFNTIVKRKIVSVSSRIIFLLKSLYKQPKQRFMAFFELSEERSEIVATFLAVLELVKANRITVTENQSHIIFNSKRKDNS
ncbi:MAG: segregation/condensation protein A [Oscillospiraceae bacterium]